MSSRSSRLRVGRWIGGSIAGALVVGAALGLALAQPTTAGNPQTFFRTDYTNPGTAPDLYAPPIYPIGARLHLSSGPTDRGSITFGIVLADGALAQTAQMVAAAQGADVQVGHAYVGLPLLSAADTLPDAPAASCAGMTVTIDEMTAAVDGVVAVLALHASCPSIGRAYEVRIASEVPYAAYATSWLGFTTLYPGASETRALTISSVGTAPLALSDLLVVDEVWGSRQAHSPSLEFSVVSETCTQAPVQPGASCVINLQYLPLTLDSYHPATISATANNAAGRYRTSAFGGARDPISTPPGFVFGSQMESVPSAPHRFAFAVAGGGPRTFGPIEIIGSWTAGDAADYKVTEDTCTPAPVLGGTTCYIDVVFAPTHMGSSRANIAMHGDSIVDARQMTISGEGISPISLQPKLEFGYQTPGGTYLRTATLTSLADAPISLAPFTRNESYWYRNPMNLSLDSETCTQAPLPAHGSCTLTFAFAPDAAAVPGTWSETVFVANGDGWAAQSSIMVNGIARTPDPGAEANPKPVLTVNPYVSAHTEGDYVEVLGTYADPRGLLVAMTPARDYSIAGPGPSGTWIWTGTMPDGPSVLDVVITGSDADATSDPVVLHFTIANAVPRGTVEGPGLVPATGEQRTYRVAVSDPGQDLVSVTPTCGSGVVVSFKFNQTLVCSFSTESVNQVGVTATDKDGATRDILIPVTATVQVRDRASADITLKDTTAGSPGGAVALVDLNGDGRKEIVAAVGRSQGPNAVVVLLDAPATGMSLTVQAAAPHGFTIYGPADAVWFGSTLASAGDVNGDGVEDLLVGAQNAQVGGGYSVGSVFVIYGGGPATDLHLDSLDPAIGFRIDGAKAGSSLGSSLAGGGDVNGDGYGDIALGALGDGVAVPGSNAPGAAYVVFGGPSLASFSLADPPAGRWVELSQAGSDHMSYGFGLAIGDVNGDGLADVVSGGAYYVEGVFVTWGSPAFAGQEMGEGSSAAWTNLAAGTPTTLRVPSLAIGYHLAVADVDGDGVEDIVAGYYNSDSTLATIFFGERDAASTRRGYLVSLESNVWGNIAAAGDMNGDGYADIVVRGRDDRIGYTTVVGGRQATETVRVDSTARAWIRVDDARALVYPPAVAMGDVNGDGLADLVIREGAALDIVLGSLDRLAPTVSTPGVGLATGTVSAIKVPLRISWAATDKSSGVRDFTVLATRDGATTVGTSLTSARAVGSAAVPLHRYRWYIRARDWAGNRSTNVPSPTVRVVLVPETSSAIHWTGRWTRLIGPNLLGHQSRLATVPGASASFTFRGRSIGWVATRGRDRATATVYLDGVKVSTVSLYGSLSPRRMVFTHSWLTSGTHTIRIVVGGTRGHARVDVDGFVILQ